MPEHCDRCGTELGQDQARHNRYHLERPGGDPEEIAGRLCSDCVVDFESWLETR